MNYKELYKRSSEKLKLQFLDAIISNNSDLQTSFVNFADATNRKEEDFPYERFVDIINKTKEIYQREFEAVNLEDPDWDHYTPPHTGYIEEWEQYQLASEQELSAIFHHFRDKATDLVICQNISELTAMMIGLFLAAKNTEIDDPLESFENINDHLLQEYKETTTYITEKVSFSAISDHSIMHTIGSFFQHLSESDLEKESYASVFEDYLISLAGKTTLPEKILDQLDDSDIDRKVLPRLTLLLTGMTGEQTEWLRLARAYYKGNDEISRQLLKNYYEHDQKEFQVLAKKLFELNHHHWAPVLSDMVTPDLSLDLFVKVYLRLVYDNRELKNYLQVRPFLSEPDKERFLREIDWDKPFKVQVLEVEERYEEIRQIVERNQNYWVYTSLIQPILGVYPEFCFNSIRQTILKTISTERGRSVYQRIVEWLQLADTIPGFKPQIRILARDLYQIKPSLPALKDELRKGGLV